MTPALTFKVKPTTDGGFEIEVKPNQPKEPKIVEMRYTCMPGARRKEREATTPKMFV